MIEFGQAAPEAPDGEKRVTVWLECTRSEPGHPIRVRMAGRMSDGVFRAAVLGKSVQCPMCKQKLIYVNHS